MGIGAALAAAIAWVVASTILARQVRRVDTLSASFLRTLFALLFFAVAIFALDAEQDFARMRATDILQFLGTGVVTLAIGENLYAAAVSMIGLARAFTLVVGLYNLMAFVLAALLLGEEVTWRIVLGALLVVLGVYLVALYGRVRTPPIAPATAASSATSNARPGRRRWPPLRPAAPRADARAPGTAAPPDPLTNEPLLTVRPPMEVHLLLVGALPSSFALGVVLALLTGLTWAGSAVWLRSVSEGFDAAAVGAARLSPLPPRCWRCRSSPSALPVFAAAPCRAVNWRSWASPACSGRELPASCSSSRWGRSAWAGRSCSFPRPRCSPCPWGCSSCASASPSGWWGARPSLWPGLPCSHKSPSRELRSRRYTPPARRMRR